MGGVAAYRTMLAKALELLAPVQPKVVAIDMVLADKEDAAEDDRLLPCHAGDQEPGAGGASPEWPVGKSAG